MGQQGVGVVVRTSDVQHLIENLDTFSLRKLSQSDLRDLNLLRFGDEREPKPIREDGERDSPPSSGISGLPSADINEIMNALMGDIMGDIQGPTGEKKKEDKKKEE